MAIDGKWKITAETPMGAQESTLEVTTSGDALTGSASSMFGTVPITNGKVDGDSATWDLAITMPMALTMKNSATFTGDSVTGSVEIGMFGSFPFKGVRET